MLTDDEITARLAEALSREAAVSEVSHDRFAYYEGLAAALLPVVREMLTEEHSEGHQEGYTDGLLGAQW